jgi:cyclopropane-fatty-acyl-phospholipid synthase
MLEGSLHAALRRGVTRGHLVVTYPTGRIETYGDGASPPLAVRVADRAALRAIALDPALAVGEMYMDGRLVIERGDVYAVIDMAMRNLETDRVTPYARLQGFRRRLAARLRRGAGIAEARRNIAHHYDLDERLYRMFLDEDMQYSCAYFEQPDMTLDQAQLAKKRLIAAKMLVRPGARVLDIGSGWGGMALYLAEVCGADVTGITLSEEQQKAATRRAEARGLADRVRFRLQDYRELTETFDNIVSVGMLEHVGIPQMPAFMDAVARVLAPDGVMLLHAMAQVRRHPTNQAFFEKYIFPGGHIPALSEVVDPAERAGLLIRDVEILALHYADTTREWRRRFLAHRDEVLRVYDERFLRMWDFYLAGSESSFRNEAVHVFHLQLARDQHRVPSNRGYIAEAQARLREAEARLPAYAHLHNGQIEQPAVVHA